MTGKFVTSAVVKRVRPDWGEIAWHSLPSVTGARRLAVAEVKLAPGFAHDFHRHPRQEEVIYVMGGRIEQWLGRRRRVLERGDSVFITRGAVHASFNRFREDALLLAVLGPCAGKEGYELVDVSRRAPWRSLRPRK
ncbi:MAG: cupin domain-containing protein [Thermoanaerobaculia bacterium]